MCVCVCLVFVAEAAGRVVCFQFCSVFDNVLLSPLFDAVVFGFQLLLLL